VALWDLVQILRNGTETVPYGRFQNVKIKVKRVLGAGGGASPMRFASLRSAVL